MSGEVDLKKNKRSSSSSSSFHKTRTKHGGAGDSEEDSESTSKSAKGKVESSSKGNISATITSSRTSTTVSSSCIATNAAAATATSTECSSSSSISASHSQSQSTAKHAVPAGGTTTSCSSSTPTTTTTTTTPAAASVSSNACSHEERSASWTGEGGNRSVRGKSTGTFPCSASSNPAVPCEGGSAEKVASTVTSSSASGGTSSAFSPKPSDSSINSSNLTTTKAACVTEATNVVGGDSSSSSSHTKPLTFNPSFEGKSHQNNQGSPPPHLQSTEKAGSSQSTSSSRLSLKNLGRRKSPVRTQFTLPNTSSSTTTGGGGAGGGTDQIPKDSISASSANTSSLFVVGGGASVSNNTSGSGVGGGETSKGLLHLRGKKERGASASPPLQRALQPSGGAAATAVPSTSLLPSPSAKASLSNPPVSASASSASAETAAGAVFSKTVPADPQIEFVPGTSAPISVDRAHSAKITRKILHNWRSACGRTKDRTKDFIRRWKTLPENSPDFDQLAPNSPSSSRKNKVSGGGSVSNSNSPVGKKKLHGVKSEGSSSLRVVASSLASAASRSEPKVLQSSSTTVTSSELKGSSGTSKLSSGQQQQQRTAENEMPVVGSSGKGTTIVSDGAGSGSISAIGGVHSSGGGASGGGVGKLSVGMTGLGRPSISVNNSSTNMVNGRPSTTDSSSGGGAGSGPSGGQSKSSTGWTVHVWATYVQRDDLEQGLDSEEPKKPDREFLSDFQKVKLTHFFRHVLDMNHDDVISAEDFVALNQRIRHYIEWSSECIEFHILKEVHSGFLECFLNQPLDECSVMYYCSSERETRQHVNIDEWLDVWGGLLRSARTMESLPLWLQYFPKILFQVINKSGSGTISREELRAFYTMFLGIDFRVVNESLEAIHKAMTDGGRHKITYDLFKLCFANFLLGKYPNGPGQYLFGICSPQTLECSFPIDYSALNTHPDDLEPYDPDKDKSQSNRRSVIV